MATQLPEPSFIERDVAVITAEIIAEYEAESGKILMPAQPEMLMINRIAYRESLVRIGIQEAAKQNLVEYAVYPVLDYLGELVGCTRLPEQYAKTTIRITLVEILEIDCVIPAGRQIGSDDGLIIFTTDMLLTIPAGQISGDVVATAVSAGIAGNGYSAGKIATLIEPIAYVTSAANITTSSDGADSESDERYRQRIKEAPEAFSTAGSLASYRYWAKTAHQSIVDVEPICPQNGEINIYPLCATGQPSETVLAAVALLCSGETVRPLSDVVSVLAPTRKAFTLAAEIIIYANADADVVIAAVTVALQVYCAALRNKLGRSAVATQITGVITAAAGVYKHDNPWAADIENAANEWSDCTEITVTVVGTK